MSEPIEDSEIKYLGDVQKLSIKPGDIIVLTPGYPVSGADVERFNEIFKRKLPDNELIILGPNVKIGVIER